MGISIRATKGIYSFDCGCGGFFNLRKNIAIALDNEFGENYAEIQYCHTNEESYENDRKAEEIINRKKLDLEYKDVLDFLYTPDDEGGSVSHRTCKKIADLLDKINLKHKCFRYTAHSHNDYAEFKEFLRDCYSHRKKMRWS